MAKKPVAKKRPPPGAASSPAEVANPIPASGGVEVIPQVELVAGVPVPEALAGESEAPRETPSKPEGASPIEPQPAPPTAPNPSPFSQALLAMVTPRFESAHSELKRDWQVLAGVGGVSTVLGAVLALLVIAGINRGTLLLNQQAEVLALTRQSGELADRATALEKEGASLRSRLAVLEGLTARVDEAEAALEEMTAALDEVETEVSALGDRADQLASDVEAVRAATSRFDSFLGGLRDLLAQVESAPTPVPTRAANAPPTPGN